MLSMAPCAPGAGLVLAPGMGLAGWQRTVGLVTALLLVLGHQRLAAAPADGRCSSRGKCRCCQQSSQHHACIGLAFPPLLLLGMLLGMLGFQCRLLLGHSLSQQTL